MQCPSAKLRLLRILKVLSMLEELSDMFHSESIHTCLNVVKLVLAIAVVSIGG